MAYTTDDYIEQLIRDKNSLVANLNTKGVEASSSETFTTLVPKVLDISGGGSSAYNAFRKISVQQMNSIPVADVQDKDNCLVIEDSLAPISKTIFDPSGTGLTGSVIFPLSVTPSSSLSPGSMSFYDGDVELYISISSSYVVFNFDYHSYDPESGTMIMIRTEMDYNESYDTPGTYELREVMVSDGEEHYTIIPDSDYEYTLPAGKNVATSDYNDIPDALCEFMVTGNKSFTGIYTASKSNSTVSWSYSDIGTTAVAADLRLGQTAYTSSGLITGTKDFDAFIQKGYYISQTAPTDGSVYPIWVKPYSNVTLSDSTLTMLNKRNYKLLGLNSYSNGLTSIFDATSEDNSWRRCSILDDENGIIYSVFYKSKTSGQSYDPGYAYSYDLVNGTITNLSSYITGAATSYYFDSMIFGADMDSFYFLTTSQDGNTNRFYKYTIATHTMSQPVSSPVNNGDFCTMIYHKTLNCIFMHPMDDDDYIYKYDISNNSWSSIAISSLTTEEQKVITDKMSSGRGAWNLCRVENTEISEPVCIYKSGVSNATIFLIETEDFFKPLYQYQYSSSTVYSYMPAVAVGSTTSIPNADNVVIINSEGWWGHIFVVPNSTTYTPYTARLSTYTDSNDNEIWYCMDYQYKTALESVPSTRYDSFVYVNYTESQWGGVEEDVYYSSSYRVYENNAYVYKRLDTKYNSLLDDYYPGGELSATFNLQAVPVTASIFYKINAANEFSGFPKNTTISGIEIPRQLATNASSLRCKNLVDKVYYKPYYDQTAWIPFIDYGYEIMVGNVECLYNKYHSQEFPFDYRIKLGFNTLIANADATNYPYLRMVDPTNSSNYVVINVMGVIHYGSELIVDFSASDLVGYGAWSSWQPGNTEMFNLVVPAGIVYGAENGVDSTAYTDSNRLFSTMIDSTVPYVSSAWIDHTQGTEDCSLHIFTTLPVTCVSTGAIRVQNSQTTATSYTDISQPTGEYTSELIYTFKSSWITDNTATAYINIPADTFVADVTDGARMQATVVTASVVQSAPVPTGLYITDIFGYYDPSNHSGNIEVQFSEDITATGQSGGEDPIEIYYDDGEGGWYSLCYYMSDVTLDRNLMLIPISDGTYIEQYILSNDARFKMVADLVEGINSHEANLSEDHAIQWAIIQNGPIAIGGAATYSPPNPGQLEIKWDDYISIYQGAQQPAEIKVYDENIPQMVTMYTAQDISITDEFMYINLTGNEPWIWSQNNVVVEIGAELVEGSSSQLPNNYQTIYIQVTH